MKLQNVLRLMSLPLLLTFLCTAGVEQLYAQQYSWKTIAGLAGTNTYGCMDGTNADARFYKPYSIAVDLSGSLYVADSDSNVIRRIIRDGTNWVTTTVAGLAGVRGSTDGTNSDARFTIPRGITVDAAGSVYVADTYNNNIRKIEPVGTNWVVTTLAGTPVCGNLNGTNSAARFYTPRGIAPMDATTLFVIDTGNGGLRKLKQFGTNWVVSAMAGPLTDSCTFFGSGNGYQDGTNSDVRFFNACGVCGDASGNAYVADSQNFVIRQVTPSGANWVSKTIAGLAGLGNSGWVDGTNSGARFFNPRAIAIDGANNLYVADSISNIRKVAPEGTNWVVTTLGGVGHTPGTTDGIGTNALFNAPYGIAVDSSRNLYVADTFNNAIRMGTFIPLLQCALSESGLTLSWPSPSTGFVLQTNADLAPAGWQEAGLQVSDDGANRTVTLAAPASNVFFRLKQ